jgi:GTP 3',8-cyclase
MDRLPVTNPAPPGAISLRVSVTDRCRFQCLYCTPEEGVPRFAPEEKLADEEILRFVRLLHSRVGLSKVHLTGGEPLARPGIAELIAALAGLGVADLALTTNGQQLADLAGKLLRCGLGRVNVSLNSLRPATFRTLTGGGELGRTLAGIEAARRALPAPLKLNTTVIRGLNDGEVVDLSLFAIERGAQARFIELMPLGPAAARHREWFVSSSEVLARLGRQLDLEPLPRRAGSSAREYRASAPGGRPGTVALISPCSQPFCGDCNRLRLTADGGLLGCLALSSRTEIRTLLRVSPPIGDEPLLRAVREAMARKRCGGDFASMRCMAKVGG